jgi:LacI family transcriptional regulator
MNKITIHDLARELGIDSSTVSRALSGSSRVAQKTKERITAKAKELGYQKNDLASNLRKNKTNVIGVVVPRISRHFFSSAISGIEERAYKEGYSVVICQSLETLEKEEKIIGNLLANRVDGVLISVSMETENYAHLQSLKDRGIPYVVFDRHCEIEENSNVLIDDFKGGFDATEHLIKNGCQNIVHFSGPQNLMIYKNRLLGYKAALQEYKIPFKEEYVLGSSLMEKDGIENAKKLAAFDTTIDGVFSSNDVAAIGAMKYFKKKGIRVPEDIALVGFSNESISAVIDPALSTVNQSGFEIGSTATELLLTQIKRGEVLIQHETIVLAPELIARKSSDRLSKRS